MAPLAPRKRGRPPKVRPLEAGTRPKPRGRPPTAAARRLRESITGAPASIADILRAMESDAAARMQELFAPTMPAKEWRAFLRSVGTIERDEALCLAVAERLQARRGRSVTSAVMAVAHAYRVAPESVMGAYYRHRHRLHSADDPE